MRKEEFHLHWNKIFNICMRMGCNKIGVIKHTNQGRLHININPQGNKTEVKVHHDIFTRQGHYSKSNDVEVNTFMNKLKEHVREQ